MRRTVLSIVVGVTVASVAAIGSGGAAMATPVGYYDDVTLTVGSSTDAAVGPDGTIYAVSGTNIAILTFGGNGYTTSSFTPLGDPLGVAISADGSTLAVSDRDTGQVTLYTRSGMTFGMGIQLSGIVQAQGLDFAPDGALLVADYGANSILRFAHGSGSSYSNATSLSFPSHPRWLTTTADGTLFVTDQDSHDVTVLPWDGNGYGSGTVVALGSGAPYGIAATDDGGVLVVSVGGPGQPGTLTRLDEVGGSWATSGGATLASRAYGIAALPGARAVVTFIGTGSLHLISRSLRITTPNAGPLTAGTAASVTLASTGGSGNTVWSVESGALPDGLTLAADGTLGGTPSIAGPYSFTVAVTDGVNSANYASVEFSGTVAAAAVTGGGSTGTTPAGSTSTSTAPAAASGAAAPVLAETGSPAEPLVGVAAMFALAGLALLVVARRRRAAGRGYTPVTPL